VPLAVNYGFRWMIGEKVTVHPEHPKYPELRWGITKKGKHIHMLDDLLKREKSSILNKWFELVIATYPADAGSFLIKQTNPFSNPIRASLLKGLEGLLEGLLENKTDPQFFNEFLDDVVRVRAVQNFSPGEAITFIFLLKNAVREILAKEIEGYKIFEELLTFESKVDRLSLLAFNIYMQCRETLFEVRVAELKRSVSRIMERACQKYGTPEEWADPEDYNRVVEQEQNRGDG
jgi:hypothetical protein